MAENDNIIDCPVDDQEKWHSMCNCYQLIFEIFQSLFTWWVCYSLSQVSYIFQISVSRSGLNSIENRPILKQVLSSLSDRSPGSSDTRIKSGSIQEMSRFLIRLLLALNEGMEILGLHLVGRVIVDLRVLLPGT